MTAGQTAISAIYMTNGTATVQAGNGYNVFSGYLIC